MSLPLHVNPLLVALDQCPVIDGRDHLTELRNARLWCTTCEVSWAYIEATSTLEAWNDLLPEMTELKIQIKKLGE